MSPNTYVKDEQKVLFVISLLRGTPMTWAREIITNKKHPLRNNYPAFEDAITNLYNDRSHIAQCEYKLASLRQTKSAAAFAVEFESLVTPLGLDDKSKCLLFFEKLKGTVKDAIMLTGRPTTLKALIDQAVTQDQHQFQRRLEEKKKSEPPGQLKPRPNLHHDLRFNPNHAANPNNKFHTKPHNSTRPTSDAPKPSSQPRGPLTDEKKAYRKQNNLCIYCGDPKHAIANCPRLAAAREAKVNTISLTPRYPEETASSRPNPENFSSQAPTRTEA
jgi:hypothetical protein